MIKARKAPRPSNNPMDETTGFDDVIHKINPTLDKIDAETAIENVFSLSVFFMA